MDGLDSLLFINSLDIFTESILVLLSFFQLREQTPLSFKHVLSIKCPSLDPEN